jgi:threonine aldolase
MNANTQFGSDNHAGVHPSIMAAIAAANRGPAVAYGADSHTAHAIEKFKEHFGANIDVYFVFNGTGANVIALKTLTQPFNAVICSEHAHINADECGAPENFLGCKLKTVHSADGKLTIDDIGRQLEGRLDQHRVQPAVVSITQTTELGTVYTLAEIREIATYCHDHSLYLHMDGARIANAAAGLNVGLNECSGALGVDLLSFGGAKNGLLFGEALVSFQPQLSKNTQFIRKQAMQLASKMRFIAAQFSALLTDDLWLENAAHANRMAQLLAEQIKGIPDLAIVQPVQANAIFASLPRVAIDKLLKKYFFYIWDEEKNQVRWMTSFATTEEDIAKFAAAIRESCK